MFKNKSILVVYLLLFLSFQSVAQSQSFSTIIYDFEANMKAWGRVGNEIRLTTDVSYQGKKSLEICSGSTAECLIKLLPNSTYKISAHVKTASGSDEIQMKVKELGENNVNVASALADWVLIEKEFHTVEGQNKAMISFSIADNPTKNSAWVDNVVIERIGDYVPQKIAGIRPLPKRVVKNDLGLETQPNSKLDWMQDAKFGMFIHWGLYAGPAKGEWYMESKGILPEEYRKLAYPASGNEYFVADKFNSDEWAQLAKDAGMKYMNLTTQHHDGYCLFESKYMNAFSSKQTHNRDFVKEYVSACRKQGLRVGLYKTLINWRFPGYYDVSGTDCKKNHFGYTTDIAHKENARLMKEELFCQVKELVTNYGKIDQIFWDGGWLGQQSGDVNVSYFWESGKYLDALNQWPVNNYFQDVDTETGKPLGLMGMVRKYQPDILVNPRCGWVGDYKTEEGAATVSGPVRSEELYEKCMTFGNAWGYNSALEDSTKIESVESVKKMLSNCVVRNINLLLNVGPDRHGQIPKAVSSVLISMGKWLSQVGEAVYGTRGGPWNPKDGQYGFTYRDKTIYVYLLSDFNGNSITLPALNKGQKAVKAYQVAGRKAIKLKQTANREVTLSGFDKLDKTVTMIAVELNSTVF